jgi:hypothetical protein
LNRAIDRAKLALSTAISTRAAAPGATARSGRLRFRRLSERETRPPAEPQREP